MFPLERTGRHPKRGGYDGVDRNDVFVRRRERVSRHSRAVESRIWFYGVRKDVTGVRRCVIGGGVVQGNEMRQLR